MKLIDSYKFIVCIYVLYITEKEWSFRNKNKGYGEDRTEV